MPDIIRLLPESLANQIAAGEVVQRPASVVKELLENSIDAKSTDIKLVVREAGRSLIQVIDNGIGMSETDARMCFERHATSKIRSTEDLFNIHTMGFRGEAMASIAAVAQVELKTRKENEELGNYIHIEASQIKEAGPAACAKGASLAVKNLFFNVPARRNFLKANTVEFKHIAEEFTRVALANPHISFSLYHNDEEVFILNAAKLANRILALLGNQLKNQLAPCKEETPLVKIQGYIGKPGAAKKTRGDQYFFVNNRYIRHPYLHHAVAEAYKGMIDEDSFPLYVLFIEIEPRHIDINVHPTKTEIKFDDERTIYSIVNSAIRKAISAFNLSHNLDFSENVNHNIFENLGSKNYPQGNFSGTEPVKQQQNSWKQLYEGLEKNMSEKILERPREEKLELRFQSSVNRPLEEVPLATSDLHSDPTVVFQIHNSYIVTQVKSGMMLIDQQAAHERILYDKFISMLEKKFGASQQFLFPLTLELSPTDFSIVLELEEEIHSLGFAFGVFGKNTLVINGIPSDVRSGNEKALFEGFIEQFKKNRAELKINDRENLARSLAKKSAIKKGAKLTQTEMNTLVEQLLSSRNPSFSPDGNHTIITFDMAKLSALFAG